MQTQGELTYSLETAHASFAINSSTGAIAVSAPLPTPAVVALRASAADARPQCIAAATDGTAAATRGPCTSSPVTIEVCVYVCVCVCE